MLRFFFVILLALNAGLFAYHQGYLEPLLPDGREPGRSSNQLNADKIKLLPARATPPVAPPAAAVPAEEAPAAEPVLAEVAANSTTIAACTEVGNFDQAEAKRFETRLASLKLGERIARRTIQETARHMVYIPSQNDKEGADKKAGELRRLGIKDFYVIQDSGEMRWGISLGIFKTEEAARSHLATLSQKGVRSARLGVHNVTSSKVAFQLRELEPGKRGEFDKIKADFPAQEVRSCEAAA